MNSDLGPVLGPTVAEMLAAYRTGASTPTATVEAFSTAVAARGDDGTWITIVARAELLAAAAALEARPDAVSLPLYGIPFGVKDSIDVAGYPTTLACPDYAYTPDSTAPAVQALVDAGAIFVGKTSLDQFATGLNGTRTPHPIPRSVYGNDMISGGSSSGSALAVALGQVPFCVATDTAGSGRVPAALNGIVGYKPSRGLISTVGLVPACKSLDCITLMATTVEDLDLVFDVMCAEDPADGWSRRRGEKFDGHEVTVGLPDLQQLDFFGDAAMFDAHSVARRSLPEHGLRTTAVDLTPFLDAGSLLYQGPWVAERLVEFDEFLTDKPDSIVPVVREIFLGGRRYNAVDAFRALQTLQDLRARVAQLWTSMDVMIVPTIGTTFTVPEVLADPIACNTKLGHYTHFGNLLDLTAVAVPSGLTEDGRPVSLMVIGPALADDTILAVAARLLGEGRTVSPPLAGGEPAVGTIDIVVAGHHLSGERANPQLVELGGSLVEATCTAPTYTLLRIGTADPTPGLLRVPFGGSAIDVERWRLPATSLAVLAGRMPAVLALGRVLLADGSDVLGYVCDATVQTGAEGHTVDDISEFGGWRAYSRAISSAHDTSIAAQEIS
ncbi:MULTISPECIES: allophanate hydrolase [unclassified Rhodococcus (in: high G+C Gram-positive bacteria)]|uniref:allophanate hydrolase n=1 Tax=unclassified Rhodococcus (in: high G+C Gram-positive bacteria) TaxID=192944 RepID=UPI000B9AE3A9|nr:MULTISPECIES: allophanate hydrolase [unclassified Rhodococcus (in: high G+C Gram-positive bacteria)]OZE31312.1 allophanate hydrolase [Rhodococcus sp. 05-2254-4]OZE41778.1 allophanate hydrolase [Rhodococcus sp. 05-2254-3]OZE43624.1 allophanate hydrolase [Rhodococcus sp. 05-2254-6]OZE52214.1 allophanate hydrolase [Rhodococcus sp. 05-2254-2]